MAAIKQRPKAFLARVVPHKKRSSKTNNKKGFLDLPPELRL